MLKTLGSIVIDYLLVLKCVLPLELSLRLFLLLPVLLLLLVLVKSLWLLVKRVIPSGLKPVFLRLRSVHKTLDLIVTDSLLAL